MKKVIKYTLTVFCGILLAACIILAFTAGVNSRKVVLCEGVKITVLDSLENSFVSKADVKKFIDKEYGRYVGIPIDSLNLTKIEKIVDGRSADRKSVV